MKWIGNQMAPVMGPAVLEAMFGHLIIDRVFERIDDEVQSYVMDLEEAILEPVHYDLLFGIIEQHFEKETA